MNTPNPRTEGEPEAVVIGHGAVGALITALMAEAGWSALSVDRADHTRDSAGILHGDITAPTPALRDKLARADMVVVAVPEQAAVDGLGTIAEATDPRTTIVETLSHKSGFLDRAEPLLEPRPVLSLNPLFHPSLGWADNTVTASAIRAGNTAERLLTLIEGAGARVHRLRHEEHDHIVTSVQAVTHAALLSFVDAVRRLGLAPADLVACAPPPTRTLLALSARVLTSQAETYWDIQNSGRPGDDARRALAESLQALDVGAGAGDRDGFGERFAGLGTWLGENLDPFADDAARALKTLLNRPTDHDDPSHGKR
ncbi:2-dehydropantoate 2-reductase N-terminal domain-containing protein [Nocardiopsis xinjiangensis]|uniref:2-dehydropantoate 2-reductase N-terminal domain-containing protein n=1 Tax=Nocardiopsis xinjiangensis TaxID=124285 RepID=UPI0003461758|nr:2-dehydropantoate 2-reductase N-terminal domain-containing protein [Nocardiopsis xinjiangensis]